MRETNPKTPTKMNNFMFMTYNKNGYPKWQSVMSPETDQTRALCLAPPDQVMPVIFVPGIMGSNLKLKKPIKKFKFEGDIAWRPSEDWFSGKRFGNLNPAQRRLVLDPENTEVDDRAEIPSSVLFGLKQIAPSVATNWKLEFTRRGWGTVMLSSYGEMLYKLEMSLNGIYGANNEVARYWRENIIGVKPTKPFFGSPEHPWGEIKGYEALNIDELKEKVGDRYWFPVHAAGYNWLRSNEDAGKDLADRVKKIIKHYVDLDFFCEKVIVVTHSMGGLAARAMCHPDMGNIADKVAGVVHGELPALGAAAAYKRMHAGFESGWGKAAVEARVLGKTGKEVTAVLANSRGGLELLPTKRYQPGWLGVKADGKDMMPRLPISNPYKEIYEVRDKWWRLMNPEWIEPADQPQTPIKLDAIWDNYLKRLKLVEIFHDKLGDYYHLVTHAHYGADENNPAWTNFSWELKRENRPQGGSLIATEVTTRAPNAELSENKADGTILIGITGMASGRLFIPTVFSKYVMSKADLLGDGTVPECSGADSAVKAKFSAKMTGYNHQDSYGNTAVMDATIYSVARIAKDT